MSALYRHSGGMYLYAGWNNITYLGDTMLARDASAPIADYLIIIELLRNGVVLKYDPGDPATHGLVLYFGEAIWVRVTESCWWEWVVAGPPRAGFVGAPVVPASALPGERVEISATIRNAGEGAGYIGIAFPAELFAALPDLLPSPWIWMEPGEAMPFWARFTMPAGSVTGIRVQAVHWDDYLGIVMDEQRGPYTITAQEVIHDFDIAAPTVRRA
jgi:hypothetical protein